MKQFAERLNELYLQMVSWRRELHQNPELSFQENETASLVARKLTQWNLEVRTGVGGHGVLGLLRGGGPGSTVALRADMDALPIQDQKKCDYASKINGVMHACGHDAHTSMLLALAQCLSERREILKGNVLFIFQHAEELSPGGAIAMIEDGALDRVDVIYGVHLWTPFPIGTVQTTAGPMMAAADEFFIDVKGRGGHGGLPHDTVDSIVVGSHLVVNLQSIVSRNVDPTEPCVISVGSIHAGTVFNVIAEKCLLNGTVRTFNEKVRSQVQERMKQIVEQTCTMFGADYEFRYKNGYPPVVNDNKEVERFFAIAPAIFGQEQVKKTPQIMAGEDFAYYLQHVPGCFMFVGAGNKAKGIIYPHHHPKFDIDESAMLHAAKLLLAMTLQYMEQHEDK